MKNKKRNLFMVFPTLLLITGCGNERIDIFKPYEVDLKIETSAKDITVISTYGEVEEIDEYNYKVICDSYKNFTISVSSAGFRTYSFEVKSEDFKNNRLEKTIVFEDTKNQNLKLNIYNNISSIDICYPDGTLLSKYGDDTPSVIKIDEETKEYILKAEGYEPLKITLNDEDYHKYIITKNICFTPINTKLIKFKLNINDGIVYDNCGRFYKEFYSELGQSFYSIPKDYIGPLFVRGNINKSFYIDSSIPTYGKVFSDGKDDFYDSTRLEIEGFDIYVDLYAYIKLKNSDELLGKYYVRAYEDKAFYVSNSLLKNAEYIYLYDAYNKNMRYTSNCSSKVIDYNECKPIEIKNIYIHDNFIPDYKYNGKININCGKVETIDVKNGYAAFDKGFDSININGKYGIKEYKQKGNILENHVYFTLLDQLKIKSKNTEIINDFDKAIISSGAYQAPSYPKDIFINNSTIDFIERDYTFIKNNKVYYGYLDSTLDYSYDEINNVIELNVTPINYMIYNLHIPDSQHVMDVKALNQTADVIYRNNYIMVYSKNTGVLELDVTINPYSSVIKHKKVSINIEEALKTIYIDGATYYIPLENS